jgi:hypothetical protein
MVENKIPKNIYDLRKEIEFIENELSELGDPVSDIPEMIDSSNLLRTNEYLLKSDQKKTNLISTYAQYSASMETLLSSVFEIQTDLKNILYEQSLMIKSQSKPKSKPKPKK